LPTHKNLQLLKWQRLKRRAKVETINESIYFFFRLQTRKKLEAYVAENVIFERVNEKGKKYAGLFWDYK
jgi:hypothetical protein